MARQKRSYWHWLGVVCAVLVPAVVTAALTLPNTFTAGTPIKAADMNANFQAIVTHDNSLDLMFTQLQGQVNGLQAAAPIGFAHFGGATVSSFGGVATTGVTVSGTGYPYTVTFTGSYPAAITPAKVIVQATAESGNSMLANAQCTGATATTITLSVWVWNQTAGGATTTNGAFVTLFLGK